MSEKFKISGVGIDTSQITEIIPKNLLGNYKYVHTNISSGNDSSLKYAFDSDAILVTTIDFLDKSETAIISHLKELGRDCIDLLLVDAKCDIENNVDLLNNLIISGIIKEVGISKPTDLKALEKITKIISKISFVSLDICPLKFPWSIIKYCRENDIKIIGFNPFGDKANISRLISSFSVPYLLSFIAAYSDIVFLVDSPKLESQTQYLFDLIDKEYGKELSMSQDVDKLLKEPKKTIYTSLKLDSSLILPYESEEAVFSYDELEFGINKEQFNIQEVKDEDLDTLETLVKDYYDSFSGAPEDNPTPQNALTLMRPRILDLARLQFSEIDGWSVFCTKVSNFMFAISGVRKTQEKRLLRKSKEKLEQYNYILFYDGSNFIFRKLQNAEEEG